MLFFSSDVAAFDDYDDCSLIGFLDMDDEFRAAPYEWSFDF